MIFVNDDLDIQFKVSDEIFVLATAPSFLWEFGKNRSYNSWYTTIFANADFNLHFGG